jgi:hypothetical protein
MNSLSHLTSWIIASSTSSKSHFWMPRRQKMSRMVNRPLETSFYRINSSRILGQPEGKNWILSAIRTIDHRFLDSAKVAFWVRQRANNPVSRCFETMKLRFIDFNQVVYCGGQKAGFEFSGHFDKLNHRFIDFNKVAFCVIQKTD